MNSFPYPCSKDCQKRSVGCHGTCQEYKDAKKAHAEKKASIRDIKRDERDITSFMIASTIRNKKRCRMN